LRRRDLVARIREISVATRENGACFGDQVGCDASTLQFLDSRFSFVAAALSFVAAALGGVEAARGGVEVNSGRLMLIFLLNNRKENKNIDAFVVFVCLFVCFCSHVTAAALCRVGWMTNALHYEMMNDDTPFSEPHRCCGTIANRRHFGWLRTGGGTSDMILE
jgi:hypothetical protein